MHRAWQNPPGSKPPELRRWSNMPGDDWIKTLADGKRVRFDNEKPLGESRNKLPEPSEVASHLERKANDADRSNIVRGASCGERSRIANYEGNRSE